MSAENSRYDQEAVCQALATGSEIIFTRIVQTYSSRLLMIAYYITKDQPAAEDIVQETFIKLWQRKEIIKPGNLGGWLHRVVSNAAYKHLRKESKKITVANEWQVHRLRMYDGVEERLMNKELAARYDKACRNLPERQRMVYQLSQGIGLRRNEIAHYLNISPNTVKVHLLKAVQFVKEHIGSATLFIAFLNFNLLFFCNDNTKTHPRDLNRVKREHDLKDRKSLAQIQQHLGNTRYQY